MNVKLHSFLSKHFSSELFTEKQVLKMLLPLILDIFFINGIAMLTTSMVSTSGQDSVAAVSLMSPITTLIVCIINAVAAGGTVVVAQYKGRNNKKQILQAAGQTITLTIMVAVVLNILIILMSSYIVNFFFSSVEIVVKEKSIVYLIGVSISAIIFSVYSGIFSIFRGIGNTKVCLQLTMILNISYFLLCFLFVNIFKLDILGTVLALNLARVIGLIVSTFYLFYKKNRELLMKRKYVLQWQPHLIKSIFKISLPFSAEQCFFYGGAIIGQIIIADLGTQVIAANAIATSLFGVISAAPLAVGNLSVTVIGQCIGAEKRELARWYGGKFMYLSTFLVLISIFCFWPFRMLFIQLYKPDLSTIPIVMLLLLIGIIPMPFVWSMSNIMPYILRSAGDAVYSSVISLITMWIVRVGIGYLLAITLRMGINGIWIATSMEWIVRYFLFYYRYRGRKWLTKNTI
ncbi:MAG: MATE family efflux transporter [Eubacteriales bacterium]